ncbi:MAG TPA: UbiA family prenyltransferase [Geminicoccaceae bacterium]|nr:UbiA family prenyltransferase [Geminicoccaceae bacterium]
MSWQVALRLGRVSNLPTVWTNTLTGIVLAGGVLAGPATVPLLLAMSLLYVGGMYLNDAFDARIDAVERPERPIPSGAVSERTVFTAGFAMLAAGVLLLFWTGYGPAGGTGPWPGLCGLVLAGAIVLYDWHHKDNPLSPALMGICRVLVYLTAGHVFAAPVPAMLWLAALLLLCYLIGLTYVAKQENLGEVGNLWPLLFLAAPLIYGLLQAPAGPTSAATFALFAIWVGVALWLLLRRRPGDVPRAVVSLIAGIALLDAVLIAAAGAPGIAWLAVAGFVLTLALQRLVPGT